jgi:hypothetical protein
MLRPRVLLEMSGAREPRLRQWSTVLVHHGGGEGGHYFSADAARIWKQMLQVVLRYPYAGVDFRGDPDMVLPPGEAFDHQGTFFDLCCLLRCQSIVYDIDVDTICCCLFCACADVAPRGHDVEMQRASAR